MYKEFCRNEEYKMNKFTVAVIAIVIAIFTCVSVSIVLLVASNNAKESDGGNIETTEPAVTPEPAQEEVMPDPPIEDVDDTHNGQQMFDDTEVVETPTSEETVDEVLNANYVTVTVCPKDSMPENYFDTVKDEVYGQALIDDLNTLWTSGSEVVIDKADFIYSTMSATLVYYVKDSNCAIYYEAANNDWTMNPYIGCTDGNIPAVVYSNGVPENASAISEYIGGEFDVDEYPVFYSDYAGGSSINLTSMSGENFTVELQY